MINSAQILCLGSITKMKLSKERNRESFLAAKAGA